MLFLALLVAFLHLVFSAPTMTSLVDILDPPGPTIPLTIFGHELPECVNPARYRTLQGIIWSCLATIFACTWVSMHPNVPDPRWSGFRRLWERIVLMFYAVIAPEFIAVWAFRQRMMAVEWANQYNKQLECGLLYLELDNRANASTVPPPPNRSIFQCIKEWFRASENRKCQKVDPAWTLTHGFLFEMQGLTYFIDGKPSEPRALAGTGYFRGCIIGCLGREEVIVHPSQIPPRFIISEEEINDKSKGDAFAKLVVIIQTSWFIIQCIARWAAHLHVTELEIVTLAFALLNIIIYVLWWNKPQNMGVAIRVQEVSAPPPPPHGGPDLDSKRTLLANRARELFSYRETEFGSSSVSGEKRERSRKSTLTSFKQSIVLTWKEAWVFLLSPVTMLGLVHFYYRLERCIVRFYSSEDAGTRNGQVALITCVIGALFGGVHLIPFWLSSFPSVWQKYLWLASSVFIIVEPVVVAGSGYIMRPPETTGVVKNIVRWIVFNPSHTVGFFLYVVCRLVLIFLAFDNLRFIPPDAFVNVEWSTFFPHI
ncbi:hypothetical protein AN958_11618 [Leucoagaricus sp. SymC.cos]|nr:hypothetical protein AN958_11618 [Leucoagaricus sp. SymC.cos]